MSLTLAIDTATPQVSVALTGPDGPLGELSLRAGRRHGETLAPAIDSLLSLSGVTLAEVRKIAVDVGPGLFTGLRVGVATAKALGSALGLPLVPCLSLDILAHALAAAGRPVAAVVDARRGEVFWARYEPAGGEMAGRRMTPTDPPAVVAPEKLAEELVGDPGLLLVGDGARRYFAGGAGAGRWQVAPELFDHPSAAVLAESVAGAPGVPAEEVTPVYLRGADVRIGWEQR